MDNGWIKLYRKIVDCGFFNNPELSHFWVWCLCKASHKEHKQSVGYQVVDVFKGQFIFGRKSASLETGLSEQTIRTCIETLKNLENIRTQVTNKFTIVTICNWDTYQEQENEINQQVQPLVTNNQPASNHKQECKNDNKYIEHKFLIDENFKILWDAWLDVRKKIKAPNTHKAMSLSLNKLDAMGIENAKKSLEQSIERGWRGVFEVKKDLNIKQKSEIKGTPSPDCQICNGKGFLVSQFDGKRNGCSCLK